MTAEDPDITPPNTLLAALRYAALGFRVLPVAPSGKAPILRDWPARATVDPGTIREWWQRRPAAGIGLAMGTQPDGRTVIAVDIDNHNPAELGADTIADHEESYGPLPATPTAVTGSGGAHLLFVVPADTVIGNDAGRLLGPGVDIRSDGGQIVVEPSTHPNGRLYQWEDGLAPWDIDVAPAPGWLVALLTAPAHSTPPEPPAAGYSGADRPGDLWAAVTTWADLLQPDGAGYLGTTRAGISLWSRPGLEGNDRHTSATTGAVANCLHVFTTGWAGLPAGNHTKLGYLAHTRFGGDMGAAARWLVTQGHSTPHDNGEGLTFDRTESPGGGAPKAYTTGRMWDALIHGDDITRLPAVEWLIPGVLQANSLAALYGPPKTFKTFAAIDLAMHLANRGHWRNIPVPDPVRTLYVVAEGAPGVGPRAAAWVEHHGGGMDLFSWVPLAPDLFQNVAEAMQLAAIADRYGIGLVVVDTLARSIPGAEENSAKDLGVVIRHLDLIRTNSQAAVMVVHHMGKVGGQGMRGSSALRGAIDTGLELAGDRTSIRMAVADQKNAESGREFWWKPTASGASIVLEPSAGPTDKNTDDTRVMQLNCLRQLYDLGGTASDTEWKNRCAVMLNIGRDRYQDRRSELLASGDVSMETAAKGAATAITWTLTEAGLAAIEVMD